MNLVNYIKSLFPTFKKDKVIDSCNLTKQSIREHALPSYESASELFKSTSFQSKEMKDYVLVYSKTVEKVSGVDLVSSIRDILKNTLVLLDNISELSKNEFSQNEASIALTYKKSTLLRTIQAAEFANIYSRKFLNYVYVLETTQADKSVSLKDSLLPVEVKWLEDNFLNFCLVCSILLTSKDKYNKGIKELPEATITELTETTLPETLGMAKLDPLNMRGLSIYWNPFYMIALARAQWQAENYKASQAELELLQLRKLNLEKLQQNQPDAKLQKQIDYMQNRVDGLNFKLKQMEEDYDISNA
jgi:hypothetical protein